MALEPWTLSTDPLLVLMAAECETVEDELELQAQADEREQVLMAATFLINRFTSKD